MRAVFKVARYGRSGKPRGAARRRAVLVAMLPKETPAGRKHRRMEEARRIAHRS